MEIRPGSLHISAQFSLDSVDKGPDEGQSCVQAKKPANGRKGHYLPWLDQAP